jgi:hypothetical protein
MPTIQPIIKKIRSRANSSELRGGRPCYDAAGSAANNARDDGTSYCRNRGIDAIRTRAHFRLRSSGWESILESDQGRIGGGGGDGLLIPIAVPVIPPAESAANALAVPKESFDSPFSPPGAPSASTPTLLGHTVHGITHRVGLGEVRSRRLVPESRGHFKVKQPPRTPATNPVTRRCMSPI